MNRDDKGTHKQGGRTDTNRGMNGQIFLGGESHIDRHRDKWAFYLRFSVPYHFIPAYSVKICARTYQAPFSN